MLDPEAINIARAMFDGERAARSQRFADAVGSAAYRRNRSQPRRGSDGAAQGDRGVPGLSALAAQTALFANARFCGYGGASITDVSSDLPDWQRPSPAKYSISA